VSDSLRPSRVAVDLTAVVIAVRDAAPSALTVDGPPAALPSGPLEPGHRTLQAGLRARVEAQTGRRLGYVEQLYTFGDRPGGAVGDGDGRTISIAYLALVRPGAEEDPQAGAWRGWYDFLPWEDLRQGEPPARTAILAALADWAAQGRRRGDPDRAERLRLTFGTEGAPWDEERALDRYEMLYEAGLVAEAFHDRGEDPPEAVRRLPGAAMAADHRRILATGVSRLRAKIKYRPVLFELMPPSFTLLQLQRTAEALSGVALHKQNFRRLVAQQGLVEETGEVATDTGGRPARLVRFRRDVTLERPAPGVRLRATRRAGFP